LNWKTGKISPYRSLGEELRTEMGIASVFAVVLLGPALLLEESAEATLTVTHFTSAEGAAAIAEQGGMLNAGSFVTLPSEVAGLTQAEVEATLEIQAGRGAFSTTFKTPFSNLKIPFNSPFTSRGAFQFQLGNPTAVPPFAPAP
jgi:hypothetical protein